MSEWIAPEHASYHERPDPGAGWRQLLERRLMNWPARCLHMLIRKELDGMEAASGTTVTDDSVRNSLRRTGLSTESLSLWYRRARLQGVETEVLAGALALIRGMAVQCDVQPLQEMMVASAVEAVVLSGQPVHLLTPDDARTSELAPVVQRRLQCFDLRPGVVLNDTPVVERRKAYRAGVTVLSAREAMRDYLEDRRNLSVVRGEISRKLGRLTGLDPLQKTRMCGLPFGIIVNAERILIDQACEPMVIAGRTDPVGERSRAGTLLELARALEEGLHYTVDADRGIRITPAGHMQLDQLASEIPGVWRNTYRRDDDVTMALQALGFEPGKHYRVMDQRVEVPAGASIPGGMIQLLEVREGLPVTGRTVAHAKLTFQRFFRRYESLAALCNELHYLKDELWQVYGLAPFEAIQSTVKPEMDLSMLNEGDLRFLKRVSSINESLGEHCNRLLASWRMRNRRKARERLRRNLLKVDNQTGAMTAFSGRAE